MRLKQSSLLLLSFFFFSPHLHAEKSAQDAIQMQEGINASSSASQKRVDRLSDETRQMLEEYRLTLRKTEDLKAYNAHLARLVDSQKTEMVEIANKLKEIDSTQQNISPLMIRMVDAMAEFIKLDVPFLKHEREQRVKQLQSMMNRADVSVSEKFRRIMEAYQVEVAYGKTIEAYQGKLVQDNNSRTVDYLRIGRIGFYYQSLDGSEMGYWDRTKQTWAELDGSFKSDITRAFRIARKQEAPDLLVLPVQKSGGAQ